MHVILGKQLEHRTVFSVYFELVRQVPFPT